MANLQSTCIVGSFNYGTTQTTSAPGYIWYDAAAGRLKYSYCTGAGIGVFTP